MARYRLWAPWRLEYIQAVHRQGEGIAGASDECIFCTKPALGDDAETLIPHRGDRCFVMLNAFPYTSGHVMVAPFEHTADLAGLDAQTAAELMAITQLSLRALGSAYGPDGGGGGGGGGGPPDPYWIVSVKIGPHLPLLSSTCAYTVLRPVEAFPPYNESVRFHATVVGVDPPDV